MMESERDILRRVGIVLVIIGLVDIGVMIYCIAKGISYSSSFNIFAVIAGIFLLRGNRWMASTVRSFALFILTVCGLALIGSPFIQPIGLAITEFRLNPIAFLVGGAYSMLLFVVLIWLVWELGREPIRAARASAGLKPLSARKPIAWGVGLAGMLGVLLTFLMGGQSAQRAAAMAEKQYGPAYRYHVRSISIFSDAEGTTVRAVVTAWNDREIKEIPVHFQEP
jgi:hypothetical protein